MIIKEFLINIKILKIIYFNFFKNTRIIRKVKDFLNFDVKIYSTKIISAKINGGLGNQLFQIATILAYAWKHSLTPLFEKIKKSPSYGKKARSVYWKTVFRKIPVIKRLPLKFIIYKEKEFIYNEIPSPDTIPNLKGRNGIIFHGYFQSAKYFDRYYERLLSILFYIDPVEKDYLKKRYIDIFNEENITVAVHFRRGDLVSHPITEIFPHLWNTDYYKKSITYFQEKFGFENIILVVFSDDQCWSKKYMKDNFSKITLSFPQEKDYLDLYLMSCCKHQIIANSSFSWWAAYLNKNPKKIIVAPKRWFGPQGPPKWDSLYMDDWKKL